MLLKTATALALLALATFSLSSGGADTSKSAFGPVLKLKGKIDPSIKPPKFGYVSGSAGGAFTLNEKDGHASFRWNHELDVDWHDHVTQYAGGQKDGQGNLYWVYSLTYDHEGHIDKVWLYFAEKEAPDDLGFRIFFGHADYTKGEKEPTEPQPHDIHVWCVDAVRFGPHADDHNGHKAKRGRFEVLMSK